MSHTANSFKQTQYQFAAHIRDPQQHAVPPGIEDRRMAIYRDLIFNNINGSLKSGFPVIHSLYDETEWQNIVRDFMIKHQSKSPLFVDIPREFIQYLEDERDGSEDPVFLKELAHYEWVELALSIAEPDFQVTLLGESEDALTQKYTQSPLAWLLVYHFPVHQISADNQPITPSESPVCLLVYRNEEDKVKFIELNAISARLLELLASGLSGKAAVESLATEMQHPHPEVVANGARSLIQDWVGRGILLKQQA